LLTSAFRIADGGSVAAEFNIVLGRITQNDNVRSGSLADHFDHSSPMPAFMDEVDVKRP
jgi:hypothetical protein